MDLADPKNASAKRLIAAIVGVGVVALNQKLGLGLTLDDKAAIVTLVLGYIGQSAWKERAIIGASAAGQKAAQQVVTVEDAKQVLQETLK